VEEIEDIVRRDLVRNFSLLLSYTFET